MKENCTCILVDDENDALDGLELLLQNISTIEILEKIQNSEIASKKIIELCPDIVFLDIDMPVKNGFDILEELNELKVNTKIVFVTAYNQYILRALRNSAFDYLTKPIDRLELKKVVDRIKKEDKFKKTPNISLQSLNMVKIPSNYGCVFLKKDDIIYLEAEGNYTKIHTIEGVELSSLNIGKFEQKFTYENFIRISKSNIINVLYIKKFDKKNKICTLKNDDKQYELTISRRKLNIFDNIL